MNKIKKLVSAMGKLFILLCLVSSSAYAGAIGTIGTMFANGTSTWIAAQSAIIMVGYLIGAFLIISAIMKLPELGNPQGRVTPKQPISMFFVGIALFTLMGFLELVTATMSMGSGAGDVLIGQVNSGASSTMSAAMTGVLTFMRMVGYIAFIRGWLLLNQTASGGKEGGIGRGLTHIGGGVALINIKIFALMLAATFAPGMNISNYIV